MAYSTSNPPRLISGSRNGSSPALWAYTSADAVADVLSGSYFTNATNVGMRTGDFIILAESDNSYQPMLATVSAVASGSGSISVIPSGNTDWTGWEDHADTANTSGSPFQPTSDIWTAMPNNSGATITSQRPLDVTSLFDSGKVTGREGDGLMVTFEFIAKPTTASVTYLDVALFIGNNLGPLGDGRIYQRTVTFPKGQNVERLVTFTTGVFTLNTFEANGGQVQVNPTAAIDIYTIRTVVHRTHKAR